MGNVEQRSEKVAIVTGGGSGIGAAAAKKLADSGVHVCLLDINYSGAASVRSSIEQSGGGACIYEVDVRDENQIKEAVNDIVEKYGRLDILFCNAGINGTLSSIEHLDVADWDRTIETNLRSTFLFVKYSIPHMKESGGGSIIITSSINGNRRFAGFGMAAYSTSKAAQIGFMKMAALELARYKIRVNAICPGAIETNIDDSTDKSESVKEIEIPIEYPEGMQPLANGPGQPEQVASLVAFLASDEASHISGTEIYVDGTESLL
ncbi:3-ketoacyl-ACP reductase [Bacillus sp. FJAT-27916]|uniref:SDR family oxidoreductase n=1 Tax=Bacillaceae TaxID=186817 RepID=UPI0006709EF6|nr:SDR family NAD(P)-dependent oxidoreductase [Bacillus sp. FJAT-27916]KMY45191.1 3-ketoacyl-ACP reductase [Bacillus sp. FJAT-27916]